jgi:RimJ/RimL family protein N-acetyltransferase
VIAPSSLTLAPVDVFLRTERMDLRRFTFDDFDALEALDADPAVMRYIKRWPPHAT